MTWRLLEANPFLAAVAAKRKRLEERIDRQGFEPAMEAMAYTWFNRLVAIRFMELHGYLDHGYRVLSHPDGKRRPKSSNTLSMSIFLAWTNQGHRPEARWHQGSRAVPDAADCPVQRPARGHAVSV